VRNEGYLSVDISEMLTADALLRRGPVRNVDLAPDL